MLALKYILFAIVALFVTDFVQAYSWDEEKKICINTVGKGQVLTKQKKMFKTTFSVIAKTCASAHFGSALTGNSRELAKGIKDGKKSAQQESGVDCVKFQKTCISQKFNKKALEKPYTSENSWGKTYGEHKKHLEFSDEEFLTLQSFAKDLGLIFTASAMDVRSLEFLISIRVPVIKIGSGDANNFRLIEKAAQSKIPLLISTGMQNFDTVQKIFDIVSNYHKNFVLLHCLSSYPAPYNEINLNVLKLYQKTFNDINIGYSGHELGVHITLAAVAIGAKVVERHFTLNKNQKGSDHKCSLLPEEMKQLVYNIRTLEEAMGKPVKEFQKSEAPCYEKLGKSIVLNKSLPAGHVLTADDLNVKVAEPQGIDGSKFDEVVGRQLGQDLEEDESLLLEYIV